MQIDVDFDVFQTLTLLRRSEADTENEVIRRLLTLAGIEPVKSATFDKIASKPENVLAKLRYNTNFSDSGAWIGNVHFPEATQFRATYKGRTYRARIENGRWLGEDGIVRQSPSEAASAISGTNVNGWRFWYGMRPDETEWSRLDEFRK